MAKSPYTRTPFYGSHLMIGAFGTPPAAARPAIDRMNTQLKALILKMVNEEPEYPQAIISVIFDAAFRLAKADPAIKSAALLALHEI